MQTDILFLSHGGGPMPLLGDPGHADLVASLTHIAGEIPKPTAILVISAHWEERVPTITAGANPDLIYDYYGFPPQSYEIRYPAPGETTLASRIHQALEQSGIHARMDNKRGFDHGVFVPLKLMYPDADIPVVQLSLVNSLNADTHLRIGKALQALKNSDQEGRLLVLGSGFSFHNMRAFFSSDPGSRVRNLEFEHWLQETCLNQDLTDAARLKRLSEWSTAPHARYCHPREEHLLPLHVCAGMAKTPASQHWPVEVLGKLSSMFYWAG